MERVKRLLSRLPARFKSWGALSYRMASERLSRAYRGICDYRIRVERAARPSEPELDLAVFADYAKESSSAGMISNDAPIFTDGFYKAHLPEPNRPIVANIENAAEYRLVMYEDVVVTQKLKQSHRFKSYDEFAAASARA